MRIAAGIKRHQQIEFLRPKKSFSQNFLVNETICCQIVDLFLAENQSVNVLEIGPGKGALTKYLSKVSGINYLAVEADNEMIEYLVDHAILKEEQIIAGDFLKLKLAEIFDGAPFAIIGNFPYSISTQILFRVYEHKELVELVVGMFQKEVAERVVAGHGSKTYGITSVLLGSCYESKIILQVKPGSFFPKPKVHSAVLQLNRKEQFELPCDQAIFKSIVKSSFNQRRKMIRNSLKPFIKNKDLLSNRLMDKRPEQLSLEDYFTLTTLIENQKI